MTPDFIPPLIVFSFMLAMTWMILSYFKFKLKHKQAAQAGENSLHASELKALMMEAVEEATAPLAARIEALEAALHQDASPPRLTAAEGMLDETLLEDEAPVEAELPQQAKRSGVT